MGIQEEIQKHLNLYIKEGYVFNDKRFEYIKPWNYLLNQLHNAKTSLEMAEKSDCYENKGSTQELIMQQSLFCYSIINYAKCFSTSGKGRISLDKNKVYKGKPDLLAIHEDIINIRNKFSAHNDESGIDIANIGIKEEDKRIIIKHLYTVSNPISEYKKYREIFECCESYIIESINRALDSIQQSTGKLIEMDN